MQFRFNLLQVCPSALGFGICCVQRLYLLVTFRAVIFVSLYLAEVPSIEF